MPVQAAGIGGAGGWLMPQLIDTRPDTEVQASEYIRLLGYPRGWRLENRARELSDWARDWYAARGTPAVFVREAETLAISSGSVAIDGVTFSSARLRTVLEQASAHAVVLVAATAGAAVVQHTQELWEDGKPDEYFFLEMYGSAIVEHLITTAGARLCEWADSRGLAILPHDSPGYPGWPVDEQPRLLDLIKRGMAAPADGAALGIEVLDSGMLRPKKSLLAVFGVTRHVERVTRLTSLDACEACSFRPCQFRRAPYRRATSHPDQIVSLDGERPVPLWPGAPAEGGRRYAVGAKALRRWTEERLSLTRLADGTIDALFRYDGTTCTNTGRPLRFFYRVKLGPRSDGYPIREQGCAPADGDDGFTYMCRYLTGADELIATINCEKPLAGRRLEEVFDWSRPQSAAACYCDADARLHKWGLVLETIHYALASNSK